MAALGLFFLVRCSAAIFQRPMGEVLGIVESSGYVDNGGTQLHGRVAIVAFVRLPDGKGVQVNIPTSQPIARGSKVLLTESTDSFGPPTYAFSKLLPRHQP